MKRQMFFTTLQNLLSTVYMEKNITLEETKETKKILKSYLILKCKILFNMNIRAISIIKL